jgi:predicted phosphodiesterase
MRIAVLSDIHGNLMALDAVMSDIETQSPDEIWCGGDVAWGGPWARECIARVRDAGWPTVKGNTDVWITGDPQTLEDEAARREVAEVAAQHNLDEDEAQWLLNLPLGHNAAGGLLLVHGTPQSPFVAPQPDDPPSSFKAYQDAASVVVYGHVHVAFTRRLQDGTMVCNTGSVGMPKDGDTASYLLIDRVGPDWVFSFRRVEFDRRAGIAQARRLGGEIEKRFLAGIGAT